MQFFAIGCEKKYREVTNLLRCAPPKSRKPEDNLLKAIHSMQAALVGADRHTHAHEQ